MTGLFVIIILIISVSYYSPAHEMDAFEVNQTNDDTLRIAFIGDSWAFFHKFHKCKIDSLISTKTNKPVKIMSEGACGATSKLIYSRLYADGMIHKILKEGPDYCIIAAGVNDTHLKIGKNYYLSNMRLIINFLISQNIIPIILEIPNYDIYKIYNDINMFKKILRHYSMIITGSKMDCREDYRIALRDMQKSNYPSTQIIILKYDDWDSDARNDIDSLYREDRIHLNEKGYDVIDSCVAKLILSNINNNENNM